MPRRAASEIIGSLMILLIVSVLGTYLYNHTLTTMGYSQSVLEGEVQLASEKAHERLRVIYMWWEGSGNDLNLTVLNYGKYDIKIVDVYINGERVSTYLSGRYEKISTSDLGLISFTSPIPISSETLYDIVIISERGVPHVYRAET